MIKIMCPSCDEILEVEEGVEKLYCSKCFKNISVEQGKKYLATYVTRHTSNAVKLLNDATEYKKAKEEFEKVINIIPEDISVCEGLVKSTLLMSTVRESHISESMEYLTKYRETLQMNMLTLKGSTRFIEDINGYLNKYVKTLEERLMNEEHFYEQEGKDLYLNALKEVRDYKQRIIELYFINRKFPTKSSLSASRLEKDISTLEYKLKKSYGVQSSPFHKLNTTVKECYINDQVFKDHRMLYKNRNVIIVWCIISLAILGIGIALILMFPKRLLLGVPLAIIGLIGTVALTISRIVVQKKLTK